MDADHRVSHHFWCLQGMARSVGINLSHSVRSGQLTRVQMAEALVTCCGCDQFDRCLHWMAHQGRGAQHPPQYCKLYDVMERLKPQAE